MRQREAWAQVVKARFACVRNADKAVAKYQGGLVGATAAWLGQLPWDIPEYHDEQRLFAGTDATGDYLGPVAKIFASPFLGGFSTSSQIEDQGSPGLLVAAVAVKLDPGETIPPSYQALFLKEGTNCIWLEAGPGANYKAHVSTVPFSAACERTATMSGTLDVKRIKLHGFVAGDVPPVARFDTDVGLKQPTLGVKCLDQWCEIGPPGFNTRPTWHVPAGTAEIDAPGSTGGVGVTIAREKGIKGWHDEQRLSYKDGLDVWRLTNVRAGVVPLPGVESLPESGFSSWTPVADIYMFDDPGTDAHAAKYASAGLKLGRNQLEIRKMGPNDWRARVRNPAGVVTNWRFVERMKHYDAPVPGTVRFRWTQLDDTIWTPCGQYCCQVEGEW